MKPKKHCSTVPVFVVVATLMILLLHTTVVVHCETVCDLLNSKQHWIQGVVFLHSSKALLFVRERVFEFDPVIDLKTKQKTKNKQVAPQLYIRSSGIHVEKYFEGIYFKTGQQIFNVYGLVNTTRQIVFVTTHEKTDIFSEPESLQDLKGFVYNVDRKSSLEMDNAVVPIQFPFVYFSDNEQLVYMYQIPIYTFQSQAFDIEGDSAGYFAFNTFDRKLEFFNVTHLLSLHTPEEKLYELLRHKYMLKAGFVHEDKVYLITKEYVYVLDEIEMQNSSLPNFAKYPLSQFLLCDPAFSFEATDWGKLLTFVLSAILLLIIFLLCGAIIRPTPKAAPPPPPIRAYRSSSGGISKSYSQFDRVNSIGGSGSGIKQFGSDKTTSNLNSEKTTNNSSNSSPTNRSNSSSKN